MSYELQKIDCNCSDCAFMVRDFDKFNESIKRHHTWQLDYFNVIKTKLITKAEEHKAIGEMKRREGSIEKADEAIKKHNDLIKEANDMRFQFEKKEASINYGNCQKFNKPVSFIPNTCQIDTQNCFKHRRDNLQNHKK
jgi:hypothetical protein